MYLTTLDRDFDRIVRRTFGGSPFNAAFTSGGPALPMDIVQRHGEVVLRFDIPGMDPEQIELTVDKGVLSVSAERQEADAEGDQHVVRERYHGSATRSVRLSDNLDTAKIEASNANGVLEIRIPVREEAQPRKITIGAKKELGS
ncbi:MAG: Hsp20/alpha crystallin family protein [Nocardiopsaceae bacterium]|nr:Hsp20/alpha crystallin family protein [Nocardiopsaceae bacterium]